MSFIAVAIGGAVGSFFRYLISLIPFKPEFPILTFATNVIGAVLIGIVVGLSTRVDINKNQTGVCGGFTTFSTFSLESFNLIKNGNYINAGAYIILSILCCLIGVLIGNRISNLLI